MLSIESLCSQLQGSQTGREPFRYMRESKRLGNELYLILLDYRVRQYFMRYFLELCASFVLA